MASGEVLLSLIPACMTHRKYSDCKHYSTTSVHSDFVVLKKSTKWYHWVEKQQYAKNEWGKKCCFTTEVQCFRETGKTAPPFLSELTVFPSSMWSHFDIYFDSFHPYLGWSSRPLQPSVKSGTKCGTSEPFFGLRNLTSQENSAARCEFWLCRREVCEGTNFYEYRDEYTVVCTVDSAILHAPVSSGNKSHHSDSNHFKEFWLSGHNKTRCSELLVFSLWDCGVDSMIHSICVFSSGFFLCPYTLRELTHPWPHTSFIFSSSGKHVTLNRFYIVLKG